MPVLLADDTFFTVQAYVPPCETSKSIDAETRTRRREENDRKNRILNEASEDIAEYIQEKADVVASEIGGDARKYVEYFYNRTSLTPVSYANINPSHAWRWYISKDKDDPSKLC